METKFTKPLADVAVTADGTQVQGYASLWGAEDQGGDIVERGAYGASLCCLVGRNETVKMLWQHDLAQPIGLWDEVREDARGLYVKGRILPDVERGREAAALVRAGAIDGLSIGYRTIRATKDAAGRRRLHELELWEVSLVTFPMLRDARLAQKGDAALLHELAAAARDARARLRT